MIQRFTIKPHETLAALITLANITLIWSHRFLPLYDYPIWLYEVRIMRAIAMEPFASLYEWSLAPVPNVGFIVPVWLMSFLVPIETAGKIFLSLCVVGLPWSFWFLIRRVSTASQTPVAFAAFPFAFNIFFFGGNAFLAGVIVLFVMMGCYFPRLKNLHGKDFLLLSMLLLLLYFTHAFAFAVGALAFLAAFGIERKDEIGKMLMSCLPAAACAVWYAATAVPAGRTELQWSFWNLAQSLLKPVFLFIKSYVIENPIPLTPLNVAWLVVVVGFIVVNLWRARASKSLDRRFALTAFVLLVLTLALPELFLGINQAGSRFGFCMILFSLASVWRVTVHVRWGWIFLAAALLVNLYCAFHFEKVNEQMEQLYADLTTQVERSGKSFRSFRFDYPPPRDVRDVAAASVDPLFGVASYAMLDSGGATWIFGTSLLRYTWEGRKQHPPIPDMTKAQLAQSLFGPDPRYRYDITVIVGQESTVDSLLALSPAQKIIRASHWTIVQATSDSVTRESVP
jgi:hypothetical protein